MKKKERNEFTIKEFSEETGIPCSSLRYYEKEKLLPSIQRGANGHRIYNECDLHWIDTICCLKNTDMPIHEMREFVALSTEGDATLKKRLAIVLAHKEKVTARIDELKKYLEHINYKADYLLVAYESGSEAAVKEHWYPKRGLYKNSKNLKSKASE